MAKNKTTENTGSVADFIGQIGDETKLADCKTLVQIFETQTGQPAKMWGTAIIGFGSYHYKYESGREGDAPLVAFSLRANAISLYLSANFTTREQLLKKLGKHKTGKGCINISKLSDVDNGELQQLVKDGFEYAKEMHK